MTPIIMQSYIFMILYLYHNNVLQGILRSILIFYANLQKHCMFVIHL